MKQILLFLTFIIGFFGFSALSATNYVSALSSSDAVCEGVNGVSGGCTKTSASSVGATIKNALKIMQLIAGILALFYLISAGLKFITSSGSSDGVKSARNTILYAAIGLVIVLMSQAIISFVLNRFD